MDNKIDLFLDEIGLSKYRKCFERESARGMKDLSEFRQFLSNQDYLKRKIGMTSIEVKRFFRLCEQKIQEIEAKPVSLELLQKSNNSSISGKHCHIPSTRKVYCDFQIQLYCKFLYREDIVCSTVIPIEFSQSFEYYKFVQHIYQVLRKEVKGVRFNSVELYSQTGYPLAPTPSIYMQPLSNWGLQDNELVYAYPKRLFDENKFESNVIRNKFVITIQLRNGSLKKEYKCNKEVFCIDIKNFLSEDMHIFVKYIDIYYYNSAKKTEEIAPDRMRISKELIKLSFTISDTYTIDNEPFSAFSTHYTSCYQSNIISEPDFHRFNAYLLYLVREQAEDRDKDGLLRRLGLLRKISCSPPLVYALYLLFTDSPTSLPHWIAINEGIITTIALLSSSSDPSNISKFPQLWMHLEEHALMPDLQLTENYETTFISKQTRENPGDDETRRLLQAFPPNQDTIITWRNVPSTHDPFSYTPPTRLEDFTHSVKRRFPLQHPVELYRCFIEQRKSYGLMLPIVCGLSSPCVFLGKTEGKYGYFNYFSPAKGKCYSYNPHDILISERLNMGNIHRYPKIIIILDISTDMHHSFLGNIITVKEPNMGLSKLQAAILLIETLIDHLTVSSQPKYLLGLILISNDQDYPEGFFEEQWPTFEYCVVLKKIRKLGATISPKKSKKTKFVKDNILNALNHSIAKYPCETKELETNFFLFTNGAIHGKYNKTGKDTFQQKLYKSSCIVNNIILTNQFATVLEALSKETKGFHITYNTVSKYMSNENTVNHTIHPILQYSSVLKDLLSGASLDTDYSESYKLLTSQLATKLISTEEFLDRCERDKNEYQKSMLSQSTISYCIHILRNVTAYTKSPNPYCKLYPFRNEILKWIVFIQGPIHSPFEGSIFLMELCFGQHYPFYPPKLRFLSPVYHPNVDKAGHVCHPILIEDYSPTVTLRQILDAIHSMLSFPIITHAVRCKVLEFAIWHKNTYNQIVNGMCEIMSLKGKSLFTFEQDFEINSDSSSTLHPPALVCPITNQLFDNPVMTPEGNTFERHAILQHIEKAKTDPISNTPLLSSDLIPNHAIADAVLMYRRKLFARTYWWEK